MFLLFSLLGYLFVNMRIQNFLRQFFRFGIVGFVNTCLSFFITYGLLFAFKNVGLFSGDLSKQVFLSSFGGFTLSFFNSYYWNNRLVFKKSYGTAGSFFKSYLCYSVSWGISYVLTAVFSGAFGISKMLIPVLSLCLTVPLNFIANKFWAFR